MYPDLASIAALIGHQGRAKMLFALLDGREMPAFELAARSRCSPQSASSHFSKLVRGGLLSVRTVGRLRLFRLASDDVAYAIETLASIAPVGTTVSLSQHNMMSRLREARSCYDHLAGRLGVLLTDALLRRKVIVIAPAGQAFKLTSAGEQLLTELGLNVSALRAKRRPLTRICMDWTERRQHLAGSLGAALLEHLLTAQWVQRRSKDRSLLVTPKGHHDLERLFGLRLAGEGAMHNSRGVSSRTIYVGNAAVDERRSIASSRK